jgi:hypothetical protein
VSAAEQAGATEAPAWCGPAVPSAAEWPHSIEEVHRWCADAMTAGALPVFGSAEWCAVGDGPAKSRAAVRAALAWWAEQWSRADAAARDHVDASHAISGAADWRRVAADLRSRRANAHARIPRQREQASP